MSKKAICFDLDGTLTKEEILPIIAQEVDLQEEIIALTEATIAGILSFERSFKLRVKLLSDIDPDLISTKLLQVPLYEEIIHFIQENNDHCYIITGNLDIWIYKLLKKIGCKYYTSLAQTNNNGVTGISKILNKGEVIEELKLIYDEIIVVGDGVNDVPMFENANIRIANSSTHAPIGSIMSLSDYVVFTEESLCKLLNTLL